MKKVTLAIIYLLLLQSSIYAQEYKWRTLAGSPTASSRFNDISFVNPNTGWVCNASNGQILKTTNGGMNWFICGSTISDNRSIAFFDTLNGWTGEYNADNKFNRTTDGGITWQRLDIPGPLNTGICGFSMASDSVLYGCGRYWGPARLIKTTNKGATWQNIDMSGYANGLVDCKFFTPDSGIVVGRSTLGGSQGIVLFTSDGGASWDTTYMTTNPTGGRWCWKISFSSPNVGFISLEGGSPYNYLKTTDRGLTWTEKTYSGSGYTAQGIGFINDSTGWVGGDAPYTWETKDGGNSWHVLDTTGTGGHSRNINRYIFLSDTLGYAVGRRIYKYSNETITAIDPVQSFQVNSFKVYQNYPNPFNPVTKIRIDLPKGSNLRITVCDILGKEISTIIEGDFVEAGSHEFEWDGSGFPSGVYYYKVYDNDIGFTKSMLLVK